MITLDGLAASLNSMPVFLQGVLYTVMLSLFAVAIGFILALLIAFMRLSKVTILRVISGAYVEIVRGTPLLVQLTIMFLLIKVPSFTWFGFIDSSRFVPGIIVLSMNSAGYVAEIIRGGIEGVDFGQSEAARSLGMSKKQTMKNIVLPQAFKNILPAIANEFVTIIKESSVCTILGMHEIMYSATIIQTQTFRGLEPLIIAAILYFCLTFPTSKAIGALERRMRRGDER